MTLTSTNDTALYCSIWIPSLEARHDQQTKNWTKNNVCCGSSGSKLPSLSLLLRLKRGLSCRDPLSYCLCSPRSSSPCVTRGCVSDHSPGESVCVVVHTLDRKNLVLNHVSSFLVSHILIPPSPSWFAKAYCSSDR